MYTQVSLQFFLYFVFLLLLFYIKVWRRRCSERDRTINITHSYVNFLTFKFLIYSFWIYFSFSSPFFLRFPLLLLWEWVFKEKKTWNVNCNFTPPSLPSRALQFQRPLVGMCSKEPERVHRCLLPYNGGYLTRFKYARAFP